jgi:hypothetical protein
VPDRGGASFAGQSRLMLGPAYAATTRRMVRSPQHEAMGWDGDADGGSRAAGLHPSGDGMFRFTAIAGGTTTGAPARNRTGAQRAESGPQVRTSCSAVR